MLITMIHVFYKLLEIYHNTLLLLNIELQNCSVNIKRVYSDILYLLLHNFVSLMLNRLNQINKYDKQIRNNNKNNDDN